MKHGRPSRQQGGISVRIVGWGRRSLRERYVARLIDETSEVSDRDRSAVELEGANLDLADRLLLGVEVGGAHPEPACGNLDHLRTHHRVRSYGGPGSRDHLIRVMLVDSLMGAWVRGVRRSTCAWK